MTPSLEEGPTKAEEEPSPHEVKLTPLATATAKQFRDWVYSYCFLNTGEESFFNQNCRKKYRKTEAATKRCS